jgi:hypothetical protein
MAAGRRIAHTAVGDARPSPVETNLLEIAVLPIRVSDCPVPGIRPPGLALKLDRL